jgi:P4 family phage/plasmid primase-like protien
MKVVPKANTGDKLIQIRVSKGKFMADLLTDAGPDRNTDINPTELRLFCGGVLPDKALVDTVNLLAREYEIRISYDKTGLGVISNRDELISVLRKGAPQSRASAPKPGQVCACGKPYSKGDLIIKNHYVVVGCPSCATESSKQVDLFFSVGDDYDVAKKALQCLSPNMDHIVAWMDRLYRYAENDGLWHELPQVLFSKTVFDFHGAMAGDKPLKINRGLLESTYHCAKTEVADVEFRKNPKKGIAFRDKFVFVEDGQLVVSDHSPSNEALSGHSFVYDPNAKCPYWMEILTSTWGAWNGLPALPDFEERCEFIQVVMGLSILGLGARLKKMLMLIGPGGNGKSTIISAIVLIHCVGDAIDFPLSNFAKHFGRADILGKKFIYATETSTKATDFSQGAKLAVRGETFTASIKGEEDVRGVVEGILAYAQNEFPELYDDTEGWFESLVILDSKRVFPREHSGGKALEDIIKDLKPETMGIINWALEGALRFLKHGIKIPSSSRELVAKWKTSSTSGRAFIDRCCFETENWNRTPGEFYPAYEHWVKAVGRTKLNADHFELAMEKDKHLKYIEGVAYTNLGMYARSDWGGSTPPPSEMDSSAFDRPSWWNGITNE